jgi:RNA polymerase II elongation factor ELL
MKRNYWKELDVWKYEYAPKGDRQAAIDNAIRQYNRMRLAHSEAQWQRLLPMEERGKGKHPSASKPATNGPAINNTKAQSTEDGDSRADTARSARSITPTASIEAKKSATDARLKQIISKTGKKAAAPKPTLPKLQEKVSARVPDKEKTKRVLSTETVDDSDSADEALSKKKPIQRPRPTATSATASTASKARPVASKPVAKPAGKSIAKPVAAKRPREDDEEVIVDDTSSSSSAPLSKRAKMQPKPKLVATSASASNPRSSDSSQASRHASANGTSSRVTGSQPKNTSPVKSSPLASSPPTNASDMEREKERQRMREKMRDLEHARRQKDVGSNKRKAEAAESQPPSKRPAVQPLTLSKASKFQTLYNKYYDLDARIRCMDREPVELVARLIRMRDELTALKTEIYAESGKA